MADADLVLLVTDATIPITPEEQSWLQALANRPAILIRNKSDLLTPGASIAEPASINTNTVARPPSPSPLETISKPLLSEDHATDWSAGIPSGAAESGSTAKPIATTSTSALTGHGIEALRDAMLDLVRGNNSIQPAHVGILTNLRQQQAVQRAVDALHRARVATADRTPHEMLLLEIYESLRGLDELTGETTADDVLNLIFSTFCIGK